MSLHSTILLIFWSNWISRRTVGPKIQRYKGKLHNRKWFPIQELRNQNKFKFADWQLFEAFNLIETLLGERENIGGSSLVNRRLWMFLNLEIFWHKASFIVKLKKKYLNLERSVVCASDCEGVIHNFKVFYCRKTIHIFFPEKTLRCNQHW